MLIGYGGGGGGRGGGGGNDSGHGGSDIDIVIDKRVSSNVRLRSSAA